MARPRVLDTNRFIRFWRRRCTGDSSQYTQADAVEWARQMIRLEASHFTVTPVLIEFLCGTTSQHELRLARAFLAEFEVVDAGQIRAEDWQEARRLAERVPRDGKPRQLADCLIRAIATRLRYDVITSEQRFPR